MFGEVNGGFSALASGGANAGSAGSGSGRGATSVGDGSNGTAGSGATSAGQSVGGFSSGSTSEVGGSTSNGRLPTGSGTSGLTSGTGGTSGGSSGSSGTGRSTGGTGSTGTGGSGTTTGPSCDANIGPNLEAACTVDSDCGCPYTCVSDPPFGMDCEPPCLQLTDCGDLGYVCNGTYCQFNACGSDTGNGSFNATCNVAGIDDGTCIPFSLNGTTIGECFQGGTSTECCDGLASRTDTSAKMPNVCVAGSICSGGADVSGECGPVCDPSKRRPCPTDLFCAVLVGDEITGGCFGETSVCPKNQ